MSTWTDTSPNPQNLQETTSHQDPPIKNCLKADPAYGKGVADALGISLDRVQ
ncbi:hypothetical protein [Methanoculleus thermophilus]|uniref:hypothetical protein n=1 Tax=Methanoculleus thermophilus TaxID=2200 RepID=UPI000A791BBA|nr:hypothetical protein [Methanoculleus thermophilus]